MKTIDIVLVFLIALLMLLFSLGYFQKKKSVRGTVISKEEKVVPLSSSITLNRIVRFNTQEGLIELMVLNKKDFQKFIIGDKGLVSYRGNIIFEFKKDSSTS